MKAKFPKFNELLDEYLKDPDCAAGFLTESLKDEDYRVFLTSLKDVIRVHGNIKSIAEKAKLSRATLYKLFSKEANPELKTILTILKSLGYDLSITNVKVQKSQARRKRKTSKV